MIPQQFRVRYSAERRPPKLGLESFLVNAVHQRLNIGISVGKFFGIKLPIAHIVLPAVVERDPGKSQSLRRRKRAVHLLRLNRSPISPRAPDGAESIIGRGGHLETLLHHETPVIGERAEVVSLMDGDESTKCMKTFAWA